MKVRAEGEAVAGGSKGTTAVAAEAPGGSRRGGRKGSGEGSSAPMLEPANNSLGDEAFCIFKYGEVADRGDAKRTKSVELRGAGSKC